MIGFFQNSMAKHHRLVFGVLLVFIVVSFVFYTGSGSVADLLGIRRSAVVLGVNLSGREETAPFRAGALLSGGGNRLSTRDVVQRIFMVRAAEAVQIPEPTQAQLSEFLSDQGLSAGTLDAIRRNFDVSEDVLRTAIVHSWKIQRFLQIFGSVPAVFEADVDLAWNELGTRWKVDFAELSPASAKLEDRAPTDEQLAEFYENNKEDFRVGERVLLSFAKTVPAADAAARVAEPTDFELSAFVAEKLGGDAEKAAEDLKNNRAARVAEWKKSQALDAAAAELSNELYEKLPTDALNPRRPEFAAALEKSGLGFAELPAFPRDAVPADAPVPAEILRGVVDGLNETLWRTDAIPADGAVFVIVFRGTEPSRVPALEEVRGDVAAAWRAADREEQFLALAREKGDALRGAVKGGMPFAEAARELGFTVASPDAFTAQSLPAELRGTELFAVLKTVPAGEILPLIRVGDKAVFARAESRTAPEIDRQSDEYRRVRQAFDRQTSWETFRMQLSGGLAALYAQCGLNAADDDE